MKDRNEIKIVSLQQVHAQKKSFARPSAFTVRRPEKARSLAQNCTEGRSNFSCAPFLNVKAMVRAWGGLDSISTKTCEELPNHFRIATPTTRRTTIPTPHIHINFVSDDWIIYRILFSVALFLKENSENIFYICYIEFSLNGENFRKKNYLWNSGTYYF